MSNRPPVFFEAHDAGLRIVHRADVDPLLVVRAIARHRENAALGTQGCEAYGPGSSLSRVQLARGAQAFAFAVKWNHRRGLRGLISDALHGSRALRAHQGALRLAGLGLAHPETLAFAERRRFGLVGESFLLTRFIDAAEPLPALMPELRAHPAERRALAFALGALVGRLHAERLDHTDLKHSNFLITRERRIVLLDLDSLARPRRPSWRRRVRALGQLEAFATDLYPWLPRTDRARFLAGYFRRDGALAPQRRALVADVRRWVLRRLSRWARQDRRYHIQYPLAPRPGGPPAGREPGQAA
jgi:Lipopolysaccharide kinase (Kdo/WaaP) family